MKFWQNNHSKSHSTHERRLDTRISSTIPAAICWSDDNSKHCTISHVSLTGMLLDVHNVDLPADTEAKIYFYCDIDGARKRCCEWVRIVGIRNNGVAVCFTHFDNEHQSNIQMMLHDIHNLSFDDNQRHQFDSRKTEAMALSA